MITSSSILTRAATTCKEERDHCYRSHVVPAARHAPLCVASTTAVVVGGGTAVAAGVVVLIAGRAAARRY